MATGGEHSKMGEYSFKGYFKCTCYVLHKELDIGVTPSVFLRGILLLLMIFWHANFHRLLNGFCTKFSTKMDSFHAIKGTLLCKWLRFSCQLT